jgi:hypothetical protein
VQNFRKSRLETKPPKPGTRSASFSFIHPPLYLKMVDSLLTKKATNLWIKQQNRAQGPLPPVIRTIVSP